MDGQRRDGIAERRLVVDQQRAVGDSDGAGEGGVHAEKRQCAGTFHRKRARAGHGAGQNVAGADGRDQRQRAGRHRNAPRVCGGRRDEGGGGEGGEIVRLSGNPGRRPVGGVAPQAVGGRPGPKILTRRQKTYG